MATITRTSMRMPMSTSTPIATNTVTVSSRTVIRTSIVTGMSTSTSIRMRTPMAPTM
jgi:hypothetical protein